MDDGDGGTISEEELDEALEWLAEHGELDYLLEPSGDPVTATECDDVSEVEALVEQCDSDPSAARVAHAGRRAASLLRDMVGMLSDRGPSARDCIDAATQSVETGIDLAYSLLSGHATA